MAGTPAVALIIALALCFDFTNGFHDAANAIATSVSTRALTPRIALAMAAALNLAGAFLTTAVATTVGKGIVATGMVTPSLVGAALVGAIAWNLLTWRLGLPSSSSQALIGGLVGAMLIAHGPAPVAWSGIWHKVALPGLLSPLAGFALAFALLLALARLCRGLRPARADRACRGAQVVTAAFVSFAHGTSDAQKTMGVITLALVAGHAQRQFAVQPWVILISALAIALGTASGGWRIIRTLGWRITRLRPIQGLAAEAASGAILLATSLHGLPVSTTHVITSAVVGVGSASGAAPVRWRVARRILTIWALTLPGAGLFAALVYRLLQI